MAYRAVIHYPDGEEDGAKLMEDISTYRVIIMREYLSKLNTCSGNKIRIVDAILEDSQ